MHGALSSYKCFAILYVVLTCFVVRVGAFALFQNVYLPV